MRSNRAGGTTKIRGLREYLVNLFFEIAAQDHNRTTLSEKDSAMGRGGIVNSGGCGGLLWLDLPVKPHPK